VPIELALAAQETAKAEEDALELAEQPDTKITDPIIETAITVPKIFIFFILFCSYS